MQVLLHTRQSCVRYDQSQRRWETSRKSRLLVFLYPKRNIRYGMMLHRKRISIFGTGSIVKAVAGIVRRAFEENVAAYNPHLAHGALAEIPHHLAQSLENVVCAWDVVTVHIPSTHTTKPPATSNPKSCILPWSSTQLVDLIERRVGHLTCCTFFAHSQQSCPCPEEDACLLMQQGQRSKLGGCVPAVATRFAVGLSARQGHFAWEAWLETLLEDPARQCSGAIPVSTGGR